MASKRSEYYLGLSSNLEQTLARIAQKKSELIGEIARMQSDINKKQAETNDILQRWEGLLQDARNKLEALRTGQEDESSLNSLRLQAESAISTLSSAV